MQLVSFDALRTLGLPNIRYIKPEKMNEHLDVLLDADGLLFPQFWQLNGLEYGLKQRIFPSPASYRIGHDKVEQTRCFQLLAPQHTPYTLIAANTDAEAQRLWAQMALPFVAKIPRSSMGEGVFLIQSEQDWQQYCQRSPLLYVQEYLPIDRDLRIVWVGQEVVGGFWRMQSDNGFHTNLARGGEARSGVLPDAAVNLVKQLAQGLNIDHGGFDIAMVGQYPFVLEFNRLFGNQGYPDLQRQVDDAICRYLYSQWGKPEPDDPTGPLGPWPSAV
ncbi:hypothetical protein GCM10011297_17380 [Bacterioplanes sanyensis]|uniref:ATP-grasp domain-containing protein n=1 Tax=Bacterioplanes sanyensis TaxID=1249553 RepID=UPI001677BE19|nr:hypothetical protein [Bacterioplanes sanyensis]GGY44917.1 hypothetical protein GCM10011297_17380 [Bacterioplanes sanyensis]